MQEMKSQEDNCVSGEQHIPSNLEQEEKGLWQQKTETQGTLL